MTEHLIIGLGGILALGIAGQWLAWRLNLPAILFFLLFGFLAGPALGILDPDEIFGDLLYPMVSLSVAIILFEGGLSLRISELTSVRRIVFGLISIGMFVTWVIAAELSRLLLGLSGPIAMLLGAVLVVSGPTVIIPLLRHIRPVKRVSTVLRWEGVLIDPLGAMLAVLVFGSVVAIGDSSAVGTVAKGFFSTILSGGITGFLGARFILAALRYYLIPDYLQNAAVLLVVVAAFVGSNAIQPESGLLAAAIMGIVMSNQSRVDIKHILQFKETLRVLLISQIFVILVARFRMSDFMALPLWPSIAFVAALVFVARPLAVSVSTIGSELTLRERIFIMCVAPRGIIAAAVASIFAIRLEDAGIAQANEFVSLVFLVIAFTVLVYGIGAPFAARILRVANPNPQGVLIVGAHPLSRAIAGSLQRNGIQVQMVDTNWSNIADARMEGLPAYFGSIIEESVVNDLAFEGIGRLLAMTSNDELNSLAALEFSRIFGRSQVYQLPPKETIVSRHLRGRILFGRKFNYDELNEIFASGGVVKSIRLTAEHGWEDFLRMYGENAVPLFLINSAGILAIASLKKAPPSGEDFTLIALISA